MRQSVGSGNPSQEGAGLYSHTENLQSAMIETSATRRSVYLTHPRRTSKLPFTKTTTGDVDKNSTFLRYCQTKKSHRKRPCLLRQFAMQRQKPAILHVKHN